MAPTLPDVDPRTWPRYSWAERIEICSRHWARHGFGTPYAAYLFYAVKIAVLYVGGAAIVISLTPGLGGLGRIGQWWTEPIAYQKLIVFSLLYEVLGLGCGSGPLTGRFTPPIGGFLYWLRPGTVRLPAWPDRVPLTRGDTRGVLDVLLYVAVLGSAGWALLSPGWVRVPGADGVGLLPPATVVPLIAALALLGLRDKTIFLAARAEHYWLKLFLFFLPFAAQIAGFKMIMLALWWGAAISKLNHHFPYVVAVMLSNNAVLRPRVFNWFKQRLFRDPVSDLRPTRLPGMLAHVGGTTAELVVPTLLVLVAGDAPWRWLLIGFMVIFHLNITSNLPMGVPLEWNVFFIFSLFYLFGHYGFVSVSDIGSPVLAVILGGYLGAALIAGNMLPRQISFLPAMRYYAGNWATSYWCFRGDAERRLQTRIVKSAPIVIDQLTKLYGPETATITADKVPCGFRSLHLHGRALNGLLPRALGGDPVAAGYTVRDGEIVAGPLLGWNFGEGHLHNRQLLDAVQRRCGFDEGDVRVIVLESQPIQLQQQEYWILDAKAGLVEHGLVRIADMLTRQPWPEPGDQLPVQVLEHRGAHA